jgi:hypothetical protein
VDKAVGISKGAFSISVLWCVTPHLPLKGSGFVFVNGKAAAESVIQGLHNKVKNFLDVDCFRSPPLSLAMRNALYFILNLHNCRASTVHFMHQHQSHASNFSLHCLS